MDNNVTFDAITGGLGGGWEDDEFGFGPVEFDLHT